MNLFSLNVILSQENPKEYELSKEDIENLIDEQKNDKTKLKGTNFWDALFKNSAYMFKAIDGMWFVHDKGITKLIERNRG